MDASQKSSQLGFSARLAIALSLALLPIGLVASFQAWQDLDRVRELERVAISTEARKKLIPTQEGIDLAIGTTRALASLGSNMLGEPQTCQRAIFPVMANHPNMLFAGLVLNDGTPVCSIGSSVFEDGLKRETFEAPVSRRGATIQFIDGDSTGKAVSISTFIGSGSSPLGQLHSVWSRDIFEVSRSNGFISDVAIIDRHSDQVSVTSGDLPLLGLEFEELLEREAELINGGKAENKDVLYVATPIANRQLFAVSGVNLEDHPILDQTGNFLIFALPLLMWATSLIVAVAATNRLAVRPMHELSRMTRAIRSGQRDVKPLKLNDSPSEFQTLSDDFIEMSERIAQEQAELEQSVRQKSVLVKEVHHRVRNNLQLLVSILNMQERGQSSKEVKSALDQFRQRVLGLSAVYERIYEADDFTQCVSSAVIHDVVNGVLRAEGLSSRQISTDVVDIFFDQGKAVPLALFVSEAIAFFVNQADTPSIDISLHQVDERRACLSIVSVEARTSQMQSELSEKLLKAFALQLGGDLKISDSIKGTDISVTFELVPN